MSPKPKPFSRPSIDLGNSVKRDWRWVAPDALQTGDTIADFGVIVSISVSRRPQASNVLFVDGIPSGESLVDSVSVWNAAGKNKMFTPTDVVFAFVKVRN